MDLEKLYSTTGKLYLQCSLLEEENKKLRLAVQAKDEELGLLKDKLSGFERSRVSDK